MSGHVVAINDAIRWLRALPDASVDLVLTDPPYSSGGFNESGRRSGSSYSRDMPWLMVFALVLRHASAPNDVRLVRHVPTQKPEDLLLTLMRPHVVSGGVVADPFAGSGSVIGAASRLGAVAWCCDADPERLPAMRCRAEYSGVPQTLPGMDP